MRESSGHPIPRDVTDRKLAEEALFEMKRELEAQGSLLRVFIKNVPTGIAVFDREMRYLAASDRWCTTYSVDRSHILGCSHYEIFPDLPEVCKEAHRRGLDGETLSSEEDRWDREGVVYWSRWEVRPWMTVEGDVGGILIFDEDIGRRKQMEEALSGMSRKLIEAQEQERARIGSELHDNINQRVTMLAMELERLQKDPSDVPGRALELLRQTIEISNEVQALSHDLHSSKLKYLGVVTGMKSWCKEFAERQKMEIHFRSEVPSALPLDVGLPLFRVLQEALHNAIKHSGVRRVEVQLKKDSDGIHLTVSDRGKGFDIEPALQGKGLGLTSMRERVRLLNGVIVIDANPMRGTIIRVRVPLPSEQNSPGAAV